MDFEEATGAIVREVGSGNRNGSPTHIVSAARSYQTTIEDLWDALTNPERVHRWFAEVSGDFEQGGRYSISGNASGKILSCRPPRDLALTWEFSGSLSWVTVTINATDEGAYLMLEHEHPTDEKSQAHWDQYGPGATGVGWELSMLFLDVHLSSDGESSIEAGESWAESQAGKSMLRNWSEAWGSAHAEASGDERGALDAAKRTANFYTGQS